MGEQDQPRLQLVTAFLPTPLIQRLHGETKSERHTIKLSRLRAEESSHTVAYSGLRATTLLA